MDTNSDKPLALKPGFAAALWFITNFKMQMLAAEVKKRFKTRWEFIDTFLI